MGKNTWLTFKSNCKQMTYAVHFLFQLEESYCELNYHDQKIRRTLARDIRKQVFAGYFGLDNSIHNLFPLFKKGNVHIHPCLWGYNNRGDAYSQSSWENVALEVTMSSVKCTDVTCKTHSGKFDSAITMTSWFVITCVRCGLMARCYNFGSAFCGCWFDFQWGRSWYNTADQT